MDVNRLWWFGVREGVGGGVGMRAVVNEEGEGLVLLTNIWDRHRLLALRALHTQQTTYNKHNNDFPSRKIVPSYINLLKYYHRAKYATRRNNF
jgi:hypothetical protein